MALPSVVVTLITDLENAVESKVKSATAASTVTTFVLGLIGSLSIFHGQPVPALVGSAVGGLVVGALTFISAFLTKHTPRASDVISTNVTPPTPTK